MKFNAPNQATRQAGLTLVEGVVVVVGCLAVLALLLVPALPRGNRHNAPRIGCVNNLRQVGLAARIWSNDHADEFPFASTNAGGSLAWANSPEVFRHYQALSNELVTPRVLICRTAPQRKMASNFTEFSNANLSYFVGLDAREDAPRSILSGDRNISGGTLSNGFLRVLSANSEAGWTKEIHQNAGNVGLGDGSVQQMSSEQLRRHVKGMTNAFIRLAIP
jgi:competence protein ComGC